MRRVSKSSCSRPGNGSAAAQLGPLLAEATSALGAWLAANLAVYHPERYRSLTLVTPLGVLVEADPLTDSFRRTPEESLLAMFNGRGARYVADLRQGDEIDDAVHGFGEAGTAALLMWNPRYDRTFDTRLARVTIPSLMIGVDDDRCVGSGPAARFAELLPNSTLVTIHGPDGEPSGHALPIEQPVDVAETIADHVAKFR